jgi:hypothetical protein
MDCTKHACLQGTANDANMNAKDISNPSPSQAQTCHDIQTILTSCTSVCISTHYFKSILLCDVSINHSIQIVLAQHPPPTTACQLCPPAQHQQRSCRLWDHQLAARLSSAQEQQPLTAECDISEQPTLMLRSQSTSSQHIIKLVALPSLLQ